MTDFSSYQSVGSTVNTDYYIADPDILIVAPKANTVDNPDLARLNADYQTNYARDLGRPCSVIVIMTNLLSQDAATRRIYTEAIAAPLFYGIALVVTNPLSRAIASFFVGLSRPQIETKIFPSVEAGVAWLQSIRPR